MEFWSSRCSRCWKKAWLPFTCLTKILSNMCAKKCNLGGGGWSGLVHWIGAMDWWNHLHTERQFYKLRTTSTSMWLYTCFYPMISCNVKAYMCCNLLWNILFYQLCINCFINFLSTVLINLLPTFYQLYQLYQLFINFINFLSTFYQRFINVLSTFSQLLSMFYKLVYQLSWTFYQLCTNFFINILWTLYQLVQRSVHFYQLFINFHHVF